MAEKKNRIKAVSLLCMLCLIFSIIGSTAGAFAQVEDEGKEITAAQDEKGSVTDGISEGEVYLEAEGDDPEKTFSEQSEGSETSEGEPGEASDPEETDVQGGEAQAEDDALDETSADSPDSADEGEDAAEPAGAAPASVKAPMPARGRRLGKDGHKRDGILLLEHERRTAERAHQEQMVLYEACVGCERLWRHAA